MQESSNLSSALASSAVHLTLTPKITTVAMQVKLQNAATNTNLHLQQQNDAYENQRPPNGGGCPAAGYCYQGYRRPLTVIRAWLLD